MSNKQNSYATIQFLNKVISIQQPSSLTQIYSYHFNKPNRYRFYKLLSNIYNILNHFFSTFYCIISKPVFLFSNNKLLISINYHIPVISNKMIRRHMWKFDQIPAKSAKNLKLELQKLILIISNLLKFKVELQLNNLKYPYHDSTILSKFIALNTNKKRFLAIMRIIIKKASIITNTLRPRKNNKDYFNVAAGPVILNIHNSIPAVLTGLKVKISGRLITERVIPKKTVSKIEKGGFKKSNNNIVDYAIYTNKNKRGSYSVKVWTTSRICI